MQPKQTVLKLKENSRLCGSESRLRRRHALLQKKVSAASVKKKNEDASRNRKSVS